MKKNYTVKVNYMRFYFGNVIDAIQFSDLALRGIKDEDGDKKIIIEITPKAEPEEKEDEDDE